MKRLRVLQDILQFDYLDPALAQIPLDDPVLGTEQFPRELEEAGRQAGMIVPGWVFGLIEMYRPATPPRRPLVNDRPQFAPFQRAGDVLESAAKRSSGAGRESAPA